MRQVIRFLTVLLISSLAGLFSGSAAVASEFEPDEIDVRAVAALIARRSIVLVDVRTAEEFAVSHVEGAIRIEPGASSAMVSERIAGRVVGIDVVLYCTIGARSMGLGINNQDDILKAGAKGVHVMKDGLIAWANADLPLVDHRGATRFVHPSDQGSRSRLTDPDRARFDPRP